MMISSEDIIEFSRLIKCFNIAVDSGDDDLYLRQTVNDLRILITKMQDGLGVVTADAGSLMGLTS